jgi:hypothetical protein
MPSFLKKLFGAGGAGSDEMQEPDLTFTRAAEEMRLKTEFALATWGLGQGGSWAADLESGMISFTNDKGWVIDAPVQVIGTLDTEDGTWLWGWDHPSVPEAVAVDAHLAHDFGEKYGLEAFTTRKIAASEEDAWTFTAVACHLAGAQGGYRGPAGSALVFMTYGTVTIRSDADR